MKNPLNNVRNISLQSFYFSQSKSIKMSAEEKVESNDATWEYNYALKN